MDKKFGARFSEDEKKYFLETAFDSGIAKKWKKTGLSYSVSENFDSVEVDFIKQTMQNLNKIKNLPKVTFFETGGDIVFCKPQNLYEYNSLSKDAKLWKGFMSTKYNLDGTFKSSEIFVKPGQQKVDAFVTIQHELTHALGLLSHPKTKFHQSSALGVRYFDSIDETITARIPKLDSVALMILYDNRFSIKSDISGAKKIFDID